ncbi:MAG: adenylate/guanylate cyclase domain-containing protein [Rhodovibrionaceae bacterium]|nr:adenylate/guanylate cyclase domain-containing protein [Rhodovibrionaceae bacterium]
MALSILKRSKIIRGLAFGILVALVGGIILPIPGMQAFERSFGLSWLFQLRGAIEPPDNVAVIGIDGTTGEALGLPKMPRDWPRTTHSAVLEALIDYGAEVVVFDFDFSRPRGGSEDRRLAEQIARAGNVVLFERLVGKRQRIVRAGGDSGWVWIEEAVPPNELLATAARAVAPFPLPKVDQAAHQFWTFKQSLGNAPTTAAVGVQMICFPFYKEWVSILRQAGIAAAEEFPETPWHIKTPSEMAQVMTGTRRAFVETEGVAERARAGIETSDHFNGNPKERDAARVLAALYAGSADRYINFYGPPGTIPTVAYHRVLQAHGDERERQAALLKDKVVFVGYSDLFEPDQPDRFYSVFTGEDGVDLSGVEIMATSFANLITDFSVRPLDPFLSLGLLLAFGFVLGVTVYMLPAIIAVTAVVILTAVYFYVAFFLFTTSGLWAPLSIPVLVQLPVAVVFGLVAHYLIERARERKMTAAMSYYLPENVLRELTEGQVAPESVNRVVYGVCLANDMTGFSTISEHKTPQELAVFMNEYFDTLAQKLKANGVDVMEFHADTIMCAWLGEEGALEARQRALAAASGVIEAIDDFNTGHEGASLKPRIGLQDGQFYLGHTGGGGRMSYSILGDPANSAARLESLNKHLGTQILAAETVTQDVPDLETRPLGRFRLVGKAEGTPVVEVVGKADQVDGAERQLTEDFAKALKSFHDHDWNEAQNRFGDLAEAFPDYKPVQLYLDLSRKYADGEAPSEHPEVVTMSEK